MELFGSSDGGNGGGGGGSSSSGSSFGELLRRVHDEMLQALEHDAVPIYQIVQALNPPRSNGHNPLFQTIVQVLPREPAGEARGVEDRTFRWLRDVHAVGSVAIDLWVNVEERPDDGALAGRFVDLLRLVAFARTDIITTRGGAAALPADAKKHRDRLRLQDPLEVGRDLGAVLTRRTSAQLRYACLETYVHLVASADAVADAPRPERAFPFLAAEE